MAFVCINRLSPGVVRHFGYGRLSIGHFQDDLDAAGRIAALFRDAGIQVVVPPSLNVARWEKLAWNIPFSTLSVTAGAISTQQIIDDPGLRSVCRALMRETIEAANAEGCNLDADPLIDKMFANTATMGHYRPSMLVDYDEKRPLEVDAILGEPVRRAQAAGLDVPHLDMNLHLLSMLDRLNRGEVV
jgi:2-dehydropantoate 2-reductase